MKILQQVFLKQENVNDDYVTICNIYFKDSEKVTMGDLLLEFETSKALVMVEAESSGYIKYSCKQQEEVKIGSLLLTITDEPISDKAPIKPDNPKIKTNQPASGTIFSKAAQEIIQKNNINKSKFINQDFVSASDLARIANNEEFLKQKNANLKDIPPAKKREIKFLKSVQGENLNCCIGIEINVKELISYKNEYMKRSASILPILAFEVSKILPDYPRLNAFYYDEKIAYYNQINIGIAMDIDDGLKVVTISQADKLSLLEVEDKIFELGDKYLDRKLETRDITASTFTISDLSAEGIKFFNPLINHEQSAILGISSIEKNENKCILTLAFDHRVSDGKTASRFLNELKSKLETYKTITQEISSEDINCFRCLKTLSQDSQLEGEGFFKLIDHQGNEKYICISCLLGW